MKKFLVVVLCLSLALPLTGCAGAEGFQGEITLWVPDAVLNFTKEQIVAFKAAYPEYEGMTVLVEPMGEGDAANHMITDVEGGADIYHFAQDQLSRLAAAGALLPLDEEGGTAQQVRLENDGEAVAAATLGDTLYAYPLTADNGYFLFYDKSVVSDPSSLESILADCERAGKCFYMDITSGWYQTAFFFGAGAALSYETDAEGRFTACRCTYASDAGVKALGAMVTMAQSPAFVNGASVSNATRLGAIVSGTWDTSEARKVLGENYAVAKLPSAGGFQLGGFKGFKLLGVKPQTEEDKLAACDALAYYLSSGEVQLARYRQTGWGPSSLAAQADPDVQSDQALTALREQFAHATPQGQYPAEYWNLAASLGDDILSGRYNQASDQQLLDSLTVFQNTAISYAGR